MNTTSGTALRYAAFISYAHADETMAARLHRALETYPVPRHLRAQGLTTKPVFRDVAELTAAHSLTEKIQDAIKSSRVLIVLCSPTAKASHWVNEEIRLFRELHGDASILSAIIDGTPQTAFPDALTEDGREPLAAALSRDKAGFKLGVTQLAAGMLGTGLDDLVQRGAKRRTQRMGIGLAASLALSGVMGFTAYQAVDARKEAERARGEAEGLVQYMIKDLKAQLEPVGRLDLLKGVGDKAVEYYDAQDFKRLPDDSLTRQAAARQVLAQVHLDAGRMKDAQKEIEASAALTREVLARNPEDTDAIFAHGQSEYWVADYFRRQGKHAEMEQPLREYDRLAQILYNKDPNNFDWVMEAAWGKNNLGVWARESFKSDHIEDARRLYDDAIKFFINAKRLKPGNHSVTFELADSLSGRSFAELATGTASSAREIKMGQLSLYDELSEQIPESFPVAFEKVKASMDFYDIFFLSRNDIQKKEIREIFEEFYNLSTFDNENYSNLQYFLNAAFNDIEDLKLKDLKNRASKVSKVLDIYRKGKAENILFYEAFDLLLRTKINYLEDNTAKAQAALNSANEIISNHDFNKINEVHIYFSLFLRYKELGGSQEEKKYSQKFIDLVDLNIPDLNYPVVSERKIKAYSNIGMCDEIEPLTTDLITRGFASQDWADSIECS